MDKKRCELLAEIMMTLHFKINWVVEWKLILDEKVRIKRFDGIFVISNPLFIEDKFF